MKKINITVFTLLLMSTASVAQLGKVDVSKEKGQATELLKKGENATESLENAADVLPEGVKDKGAELLEGAKESATEKAEGLVEGAKDKATETAEGLVDGAKDKVTETTDAATEKATETVVVKPSVSVDDAAKNTAAKKEALGSSVVEAQEKIAKSTDLINAATEKLDLDKAEGLISEADYLLKSEKIEKAKVAVQSLQEKVTSAQSSLK